MTKIANFGRERGSLTAGANDVGCCHSLNKDRRPTTACAVNNEFGLVRHAVLRHAAHHEHSMSLHGGEKDDRFGASDAAGSFVVSENG